MHVSLDNYFYPNYIQQRIILREDWKYLYWHTVNHQWHKYLDNSEIINKKIHKSINIIINKWLLTKNEGI